MKAMIPLTYILGIESSCDDTAAAVLQYDGSKTEIMSSVVLGQNELHEAFGGVVPEIAARAHAEKLDHCIETAMKQSGLKLEQIDAIAVTAGPGLIGGVVSGVMVAKGLSVALGKPLIGVNHLVGHAVTPRLTDDVAFPYLMLLVSGGHCQFLIAHSDHRFERLGGTIDDAPGEAFDKTARILGLGQPGGPAIQHAAMAGDGSAYELPRPMIDRDDCNMSFSGLKTAIIRQRDAALDTDGTLSVRAQSNLAASFQRAVAEILKSKAERALRKYLVLSPSKPSFAVAGGVAANSEVREVLESLSEKMNVDFYAPPLSLCTDNAAMIAYAGLIRFVANDFDDLSLSARPRWPVDDRSPALLGSGKKGAKA